MKPLSRKSILKKAETIHEKIGKALIIKKDSKAIEMNIGDKIK